VEAGEREELARDLLANWPDGRIKAYVTWSLLHVRREFAETFRGGGYRRLETRGKSADRVVAFARGPIVVLVPRLLRRLLDTADSLTGFTLPGVHVRLPKGMERFANRFTDAAVEARTDERGAYLDAGEILSTFPAAVLIAR
jgi:maltooligosyltrehalose synthase